MINCAHSDQEALEIVARIRERIRAPFDCGSTTIQPSASFGLAVAPRHGATLETILKAADIALYEVKSNGRGFARIFDPASIQLKISA
jgi:diguanylate cyclase (GGDEF)-like protein